MATGRVVRRCGCSWVDDDGVRRQYGQTCPKLKRADGGWNSRHGSYYGQVPVTAKGKRKVITKGGFATIADAQAWIDSTRDKVKRSGPDIIQREKITVEQFFTSWLAGKENLRPTTRRSYEGHIKRYVIPHMGWIKLADLRSEHVAETIRHCTASATTKLRVRATIKSCLSSAVRQRLILDNPAKHVELAPPNRAKLVVWTPALIEEWQRTGTTPAKLMMWDPAMTGRFLDLVADHRLYALWHVLAYRGLRRGEVIGARWIDLELDGPHPALSVVRQITSVKGDLIEGPPKSEAGQRVVPLDPGTVDVLRRHRAQQARERLAAGAGWADTGRVFTDELGATLDPGRITKTFYRLVREHELPVVRLHSLRHGAASAVLASGGSLKTAQACSGTGRSR